MWAALGWFVVAHAYSLYDDAYIYFRYVDNLWAGCGLRWNCGEAPIEGFTSPLYLALLAVGRVFTLDLETLSQVFGAVFLGGALTLTLLTARRLGAGALCICACAAAFASDHYLLLNAASGLETGLACLCVAAIVWAALAERGLWAAIACGILARPELAVFVGSCLFLPTARRRRFWTWLIVAGAVMVAARWLAFGEILPNTFYAKTGGSARHLVLGAEYAAGVVGDFPLLALAPLALVVPEARRTAAMVLTAALAWFAFFLYSGGDTFEYSRLAVPLVPTLTMLALVGTGRIRPLRVVPLVLALVVAVRAVREHSLAPQHGFPNVQRWAEVGRWVARARGGARLATVPIGAIGYFSRAPLLDLVGLTSREIARGDRVPPEQLQRIWIGHEKHDLAHVLAWAPDLVLFTKWRDRPWQLDEARAGFYAEWLFLRAVKEGRAPYEIADAEIAPGVHWLAFQRVRRTDTTPVGAKNAKSGVN